MGPSGTGDERPHKSTVTKVEKQLRDLLSEQLQPGEVLLTSIRITDPRDGDVEADVIVLFPDAGAAVVEVKGGLVEYSNGEWTTTASTRYSRRIHPTEQARKAKHALRRYLDRQPEWNRPLLRCEWFVAMPATEVVGDMGPEGHRDRLIGSNDLARLRECLRAPLLSSLNTDPFPADGWVDDVLTMLLRSGSGLVEQPPSRTRRRWWVMAAGVGAAAAVLAGWGYLRAQQPAEAIPAGVVMSSAAVPGECAPGYEPCLPVVKDLDCPEIGKVVTVLGPDPYGLDRDGDGTACESFAKQ